MVALIGVSLVTKAPKQATIWGFCVPGDSITISFGGTQISATTTVFRGDHVWTAKLPATAASIKEEHTVTAKSTKEGKTIALSGVLFGDVWVCSGQSVSEYAFVARCEDCSVFFI